MTSISEKQAIYSAYYFALVALLAGSFFPEYRVWGISGWAFLPSWGRFSLFIIGALAPVVISRIAPDNSKEDSVDIDSTGNDRRFLYVGLFFAFGFGVMCYVFRAQTFFLGDGYTVLNLLAADVPLVKFRDLGEGLTHIGLKSLLGIPGKSGALASFQIISICSGVAFVFSLFFAARTLYSDSNVRILFVLFMSTIGPMLLFFGYVENYAIFILSVLVFSLSGLLVSKGKLRRLFILPLLAVCCFMHVFGICLIPPAIYLLASGTRLGQRVAELPTVLKISLGLLLVIFVSVLFSRVYIDDYFFRFSIVPLIPDRFTVENYWLLSLSHFADFLNLLLLLVPSLFVVLASGGIQSLKKLWRHREYRFLLLAFLSTASAAFVFDPKIGMPRDWDLFSFVGIPLALISICVILDIRVRSVHYKTVALLSLILGFLVLSGRVATLAIPEYGIAQFNSYASLDKTKNMYGRTMLQKYYEDREDSVAVERERQKYVEDFPERSVNHQGVILMRRQDYVSAMQLFREALKINPVFSAAFTNLGMCYQSIGQLDNAMEMFRISAGLNPYNATIATKLAGAYVVKGELEKAEEQLKWATRIDPEMVDPLLGLLIIYQQQGRTGDRIKTLTKLATLPDAPLDRLAELAEYHLNKREVSQAGVLLKQALARGLDSSYVARLINKYPSLQTEFQ